MSIATGTICSVSTELLVADPPTAARRLLGATITADGVFALMREVAREQGTALIMVTHDEALAQRCDVQAHLVEGRLSI